MTKKQLLLLPEGTIVIHKSGKRGIYNGVLDIHKDSPKMYTMYIEHEDGIHREIITEQNGHEWQVEGAPNDDYFLSHPKYGAMYEKANNIRKHLNGNPDTVDAKVLYWAKYSILRNEGTDSSMLHAYISKLNDSFAKKLEEMGVIYPFE